MKAIKTCVLIFLLLIPAINLQAWPIPDTGQTKCYNDKVEIPCPAPGQPFYGQDGSYTINPPSYTKLDATGAALPNSATTWAMVKDNVTGLIWEKKTDDSGIHDRDHTYTWCDTNPATNGGDQGTCGTGTGNAATDTEAFIKALNDTHFGGFSDWRMPTPKELMSIVELSRLNPATDTTFFPGTMSDYYWSSTTSSSASGNIYAQCVNFSDGNDGWSGYKGSLKYVNAVRGGQSVCNLADNGDGTVTDIATGLMWQKEMTYSIMNWGEALTYAEGLSLAGHDDWRMPTAKELQSIVDFSQSNPAINTTFFPGTMSDYYWSSTTDILSPNIAWTELFSYGWLSSSTSYKSEIKKYVRTVRGGQLRLSGSLIISAPSQADIWSSGGQKTITWDTAGIGGNVKISLSRQGGKAGTFETIIESTENDGSFDWMVTGPASVNGLLKIEPLNDPSKATSQGLFSIIACTYTLSHQSYGFSSSSGTGSVSVTATTGCSWTAMSNDSWIAVTYGTSGIGNGTVGYSVAANTGTARTGILVIGGQTFTVTQSGIVTYTQTQLDQAVADAVADANAAKDLVIAAMFTKAQKDQAVADANAAKDLIIAAMFTKTQLDQAVTEERIKWDVNNDGKMGLEEVLHILQKMTGIR